ncbi:IreB family regulatory phosphoprotein [Eggerthia catenaformis]|uniref:IreB family regulatory phosphoprotein n=1 Tax=Eggerthia catenaformis TaxID=31973 RepID=UPI00248E7C13|nr:IreB family regulatory phosphoprotein [Eggerthia catenaformis]
MAKDFTQTRVFNSEDIRREVIHSNLNTVAQALDERGYNPVHQIAGYLISNDPAYISSHKGARSIIQQVDRDEIIEELVKSYLESK